MPTKMYKTIYNWLKGKPIIIDDRLLSSLSDDGSQNDKSHAHGSISVAGVCLNPVKCGAYFFLSGFCL